ncbi:MAG TPA: PhzF family phenazine biosynthesis protein [Rhodanobacteraceae bacterium]|nr:PhzF family phenazine biosynthesis protein [Rhodanobacteraceae bacterium]
MRSRRFRQIDVFASTPYRGNPVAVVVDGDGLDDAQMAAFARWTNLSETTFILPPRVPRADYRLRIFTTARELPFAGHPTLGSAHAWLAAGGAPQAGGCVVQECAAGLIDIRCDGEHLAFAAPPLQREGPVAGDVVERVVRGLRVDPQRVRAVQWVDNGPGWIGVLLDSARTVLELAIDADALYGLDVGVIGAHDDAAIADYEVRAFCSERTVVEDPVTGSLNASLGQWLIGSGIAAPRYRARQGTVLGRSGMVHVEQRDGRIWVGGQCVACIEGIVRI